MHPQVFGILTQSIDAKFYSYANLEYHRGYVSDVLKVTGKMEKTNSEEKEIPLRPSSDHVEVPKTMETSNSWHSLS